MIVTGSARACRHRERSLGSDMSRRALNLREFALKLGEAEDHGPLLVLQRPLPPSPKPPVVAVGHLGELCGDFGPACLDAVNLAPQASAALVGGWGSRIWLRVIEPVRDAMDR